MTAREGVQEATQDAGCHVYGVVRPDAGRIPEDLTGIDDSPVRLVVHGNVAAVVGEIRLDRPPGRRADLFAYSKVLDALVVSGAVAPVQFGSVLADEESIVEDLLVPNEKHFSALLDELADRAQFNLRATYHEAVALAEIVAANPQIAELRERTRNLPEDVGYGDRVQLGELVAQAMDAKRADDVDMLLNAILARTAAHHVRIGSDLNQVATIAFLVDDDRREDFERQMEALAETVHERIGLRLMGPMAPYDFVGDR
jgi:Gas vesicle synthesis protein GvpL/GvpF